MSHFDGADRDANLFYEKMNRTQSHDEYKVNRRGGEAVTAGEIEKCIDDFGADVYRFCLKLCPSCGHRISVTANYCENCGTQMEKEDSAIRVKQETHHLHFIYAGILSMALMFACLIGFIASAALGNGINTDVTSSGTVWNKGVIIDHGCGNIYAMMLRLK